MAGLMIKALMMLPWLAALDGAGRKNAADAGLEDLPADRLAGGALACRLGAAPEPCFLRVIGHEHPGRDHLGLPPPIVHPVPRQAQVTSMANDAILALLPEAREQQPAANARRADLTAAKVEGPGPLVREAVDAHVAQMRTANGVGDEESRYLRYRKAVFIVLRGDKPVASYSRNGPKHFVNEARPLPPNIAKSSEDNECEAPDNKIHHSTGRLTSAMLIRTVRMGIPILVSRPGFTARGMALARKPDLTLIGRCKGGRFLALAGEPRIVFDADPNHVEEACARHRRKNSAEAMAVSDDAG